MSLDREPEAADLDAVLEQHANEIRDLLSRSLSNPLSHAPRNPELRKNLDRLWTAIEDVRRLHTPDDPQTRDRLAKLQQLLTSTAPDTYTADSLGLVLETIDAELVSFGDAVYLGSQLEIEERRDTAPSDAWIALWGDDRRVLFDNVNSGRADVGELGDVQRKLRIWYRSRHALYALERSRDAARARRLSTLAPIVAVLTVLLIVAVDLANDETDWQQGLLVAFAGALGATLSLAYTLRDRTPRLRELRTFWSGFALQAALGAAAGVFVWIVLESGLVDIGNANAEWAVNGAVAFAAGFSEPMVLKTVQGLAGLGSPPEPKQPATG